MAKERTTNVNINYIVNRADVERAEAVLKRASVSTDNLRKSTQQFATQATQGYKFTSKAIEGMEIEVARLKQQVKLASTQNVADVKRLSDQYKAAAKTLEAYKKELLEVDKATKQNTATAKDLTSQFGQVFTAVKLFISAGIARELVDISLNMAKLSGQVEGVTRAFNRIPGATLLLKDLREATHGTVDDMELMQKTLMAQNYKIPLKNLGTLLEFAAVKAQQTGQEVDHLVNFIVTGIGLRSIKRLDDLGFTGNRVREALGGVTLQAADMGTVMNAVTKLMNEDLQKTGGYLETSATLVEQNTVAWKALNKEVAKFFTEGGGKGVVEGLKEYAESFQVLFEAQNRGITVAQVYAERQAQASAQTRFETLERLKLTGTTEQNVQAVEDLIRVLTKQLGISGQYMRSNEAIIKQAQDEKKAIDEKIKTHQVSSFNVAKEQVQLNETITLYTKYNEVRGAEVAIDQELLKLLQSRLEALKAETEVRKEQLGLIEDVKNQIEGLEDLIVKSRSKNEIAALNRQLEILKGRLSDLESLGLPNLTQISTGVKQIKDETQLAAVQARQYAEAIERIEQGLEALQTFKFPAPPDITKMTFGENLGQAFADNWKGILATGLDDTGNFINELANQEVDAMQAQLNRLREFYDEQQLLAGNNEKAKTQLRLKEEKETNEMRRRIAQKEKENARFSVIVNTAIGILKAFATSATIYDGIINAAMVAAQGAAQLVAINKAPMRFAKGVLDVKGPGTGTSDSIPARLSKGESVMTAKETQSSMGIFKAVRARKLNDKILKDIVSGRSGGSAQQVFDTGPIVKELKDLKNSQPDYVERANLVYRVNKKGDNFRQFVRSKSMGK